ncbi:MAG TPA: proton-conducting transporter membrane subunit, partial [Bacteroidota bacterium]|nr:proton-conducting transporter membrane subunit [Bacteroidota bacterium]
QLGYMFLAMGVGAFGAGVFHLMTHAFFKALLFLGAGSVIHALHDEQDIQRMGGLKHSLPITYMTFLIAALAISGIPPFSGFFSKDEILWRAFSQGSVVFWLFGWLGAGLTAFYMFRLVTLTFEGKPRAHTEHHPHEAPKEMAIPLIILAVLSVIGGFVGIPQALAGTNELRIWLDPVFEQAESRLYFYSNTHEYTEYLLMALSVAMAGGAIVVARSWYLKKPQTVEKIAKTFHPVYTLLWRKYYVDETYDAVIVAPIVSGSQKLLWKGFDVGVIDGTVNGVARLVAYISSWLRRIQSGVAQSYAYSFVIGIIILLGILLFR